MQPIWRTKQKKFPLLGIEIYSRVLVLVLIVLSSRLAAFKGLYYNFLKY